MSRAGPAVLVIGDVMTDIIVRPDGPLVIGADRRAQIDRRPGGSGANAACWLAVQGVRTIFAGRVGHADHAEQERLLRAYGVEPVLAADEARPTGSIVTLLSPDSERSFLTDRGANDGLCAADLPESLLAGVELVHVSGYSLFGEGPREAVMRLLAAARRQKIPVSVDAASHSRLAEVGAADFLSWIEGAAWLFANSAEAAVLTGADAVDRQLAVLAGYTTHVVIKLGAKGAMALAGANAVRSAAAPSVSVIDTTGAGDALLAGVLAAHLRGEDFQSALRLGVAAGSQAVTVLGGRPVLALA